MAAALVTALALSLAGLVYTAFIGYTALGESALLRHTTFGVFVTMITLLTHSMLMFYLIGKGKAVREAAAEGGLTGAHAAEIARLRRPVFSIATIAMGITMAAAILGASVDVRVVPPAVHGILALCALAANLGAARVEIMALMGSAAVVREVDHLLAANSHDA
jgi:hypothetical protein